MISDLSIEIVKFNEKIKTRDTEREKAKTERFTKAGKWVLMFFKVQYFCYHQLKV